MTGAWRSLLGCTPRDRIETLQFVVVAFLANRLLVYAGATWIYLTQPRPEMKVGFVPWLLVANFLKYDGEWYVRIAAEGYERKGSAFFPLYPLAARVLQALPGVTYATGALFASAAAFFALLWAFLRLMEIDYPRGDARRITWLLVLFPTAYYFAAIYTESTFMLFSVLSLLFMRYRRWGWAACFGFLAGLTRNTGVLLVIPLPDRVRRRVPRATVRKAQVRAAARRTRPVGRADRLLSACVYGLRLLAVR